MVHDSASRAAARDLLADSDVVPSDELTDALAELGSLGRRPAPPISPALAEAMQKRVSTSAGHSPDSEPSALDNVVPFGPAKARRRGAAVGGAVVLAMVAGMGGVAAFGPVNPVQTAIESVIRWAAPAERVDPASEEQPAPVQPESVPAPEAPLITELPAPAPSADTPAPSVPAEVEVVSPAVPAEPESPAPPTRKSKSTDADESRRAVVPPVELPELPVQVPERVTTPRAEVPVNPPELPVPGGLPKPVPSAKPSR